MSQTLVTPECCCTAVDRSTSLFYITLLVNLNLSSTVCNNVDTSAVSLKKKVQHKVQLPHPECLVSSRCRMLSTQGPLLFYRHYHGRLLQSLHQMPMWRLRDTSESDASLMLFLNTLFYWWVYEEQNLGLQKAIHRLASLQLLSTALRPTKLAFYWHIRGFI